MPLKLITKAELTQIYPPNIIGDTKKTLKNLLVTLSANPSFEKEKRLRGEINQNLKFLILLTLVSNNCSQIYTQPYYD